MVVLMKPIIFRKPKFMRSDLAMKTYMQVAESIARMVLIHESRMTMDETLEYYCKVGECINKAAKAGGFLSTKDFIKWMDIQNEKITKLNVILK